MNTKPKKQKNALLEGFRKLQSRPDDKFIVSILGIPIGVFKTREDVEAVISYLDSTEMVIFPCREWDSGEVFTSYIQAKAPDTIIH